LVLGFDFSSEFTIVNCEGCLYEKNEDIKVGTISHGVFVYPSSFQVLEPLKLLLSFTGNHLMGIETGAMDTIAKKI